MRVVVFTANPELASTPWWRVVLTTPKISRILVVRQVAPTGWKAMLARARRNIRKHGLVYLPYRMIRLVSETFERILAPPADPIALSHGARVAVEEVLTPNLHSPEVLEHIRKWQPDLGVSLGAPILRPPLFNLPHLGTLNVHLGGVPEFRGAPPGFWELWFGASEIGATVHWIDAGLDTGPVVAAARVPIYENDSPRRVERRATELGAQLFARALRCVVDGTARSTPQASGGRTNRFPTLWQQVRLALRLWWRRVVPRVTDPRHTIKVTAAYAWLVIGCPVLEIVRTLRGTHPVRVFTFHRVSDLCRDGMTVPPTTFVEQIEYVRRHHEVVDLERALKALSNGSHLRRPMAVITFDDGYRSVSGAAHQVMSAAGVPGVTFVCTGLVGTAGRLAHDDGSPVAEWLDLMNWEDLRALTQAGWHVGGHTLTHPRLSRLHGEELEREVATPLADLRQNLGARAVAMAYPYGGPRDIHDDGVATARKAGYAALFSDYGGENFPGADVFALRRIDIGGDHDTLMWKAAARGLDLARWANRFPRPEAA